MLKWLRRIRKMTYLQYTHRILILILNQTPKTVDLQRRDLQFPALSRLGSTKPFENMRRRHSSPNLRFSLFSSLKFLSLDPRLYPLVRPALNLSLHLQTANWRRGAALYGEPWSPKLSKTPRP